MTQAQVLRLAVVTAWIGVSALAWVRGSGRYGSGLAFGLLAALFLAGAVAVVDTLGRPDGQRRSRRHVR